MFYLFFFFSSRRRHTRLVSDWSSDVCSSDLVLVVHLLLELLARDRDLLGVHDDDEVARVDVRRVDRLRLAPQALGDLGRETRSEERRVGKECRAGWGWDQ